MAKTKQGTTKAVPKQAKPSTKSTKFQDDEKRAICARIFDLYRDGKFTIESCCKENGISPRTLKNWADADSEIADAYKKAKEQSGKEGREWLREKALDSLQKLIAGFWIEEPETETETTEIKGKHGNVVQTITRTKTRTKKRYVQPNPTAIIFTLKNMEPEHWNKSEPTTTDDGVEQVFKVGDQIIKF